MHAGGRPAGLQHEAAGQPAPGQRSVGKDTQPVLLRDGQYVPLVAADKHRVRHLVAERRDQVVGGGQPLRLNQLRGRENGCAVVEDLALPDQVVKSGDGFQDVGVVVGPVRLVEVDAVRLQPAEAAFHRLGDPAAGVAGVGGVGAHLPMELGGEENIVAASAQGPAHHLLGLALGMDISGVDGRDACVQCGVDDTDAFLGAGGSTRWSAGPFPGLLPLPCLPLVRHEATQIRRPPEDSCLSPSLFDPRSNGGGPDDVLWRAQPAIPLI